MRSWILFALRAGAVLLIVLVVTATLWGLLSEVGDAAGASALSAVLLVVAVCLLIDIVALVVFLACGYLSLTAEERGSSENEP